MAAQSRTRLHVTGLLLGPVLLIAALGAPLPLAPRQQALTAILLLTLTYWATEALPIPVTALLAIALCVLLAVPPPEAHNSPAQVVFADFSSPTLFLFVGGFVIAQAMIKHGLSRRVALRVLALPGVAQSTHRVIIAFGMLGAALSAVIANGAVATMLLPIAIGIDGELTDLLREQDPTLPRKGNMRFSTALMLMTAYGITVGGLQTPIGDPSNSIGRQFISRDLGVHISFARWFLLAAPIVVVLFAGLCVIVLSLNRPEARRIAGARRLVQRERERLGPLSPGERNTMAVFGVAVVLWLLPTVTGLVFGQNSAIHLALSERVDASVAALIAAALLFVLPIDWRRREFTLHWREAATIDWGTVLLMGAGLMLGRLMADTGLAQVIGESMAHGVGDSALLVIELVAAAGAILISETTSNTASVGIIVPIVPALTASAGGSVLTAVIAVFAATYGFMLPISTSANAIAYGTGRVPIASMIRSGLFVDISGMVVIVLGVRIMGGVLGVS